MSVPPPDQPAQPPRPSVWGDAAAAPGTPSHPPAAPGTPVHPPAATPSPPAVQPHTVQPATQPYAAQPYVAQPYVAQPAEPVPPAFASTPAPPPSSRVVLRAGPYWGGAVATGIVAALVGIVGVLIFESILDVGLVVKDPFGTESDSWAYAIGGFVAALAAAALLNLLLVSTPRPRAFFGWIMALATVAAALVPLTWTDDTTAALCAGAVNLLVGIAIWSLLSGVLSRTTTVVATP